VKGADILQYKLHCPGVDDVAAVAGQQAPFTLHTKVWTLEEIAGGIVYWLASVKTEYGTRDGDHRERDTIDHLLADAKDAFNQHTTPWAAVRG
jgi:hypothetical protein